ncbi:cytochrome P450 [Plectosphaerella plurivora]|uniref:Cytochrome P450 n=1 Tax=Plectosphaerella plurivora TaxID=936078 RepID=A0A9P8V171_9PEZI|nr:cytochrome P450 [Plectosphaerella plurivora]
MIEFVLQTAACFGRDVNLSCIIASTAGLMSHHLYFIKGNHTSNTRDIVAVHLVALSLLLYKTLSTYGISQGLLVYLAISSAYFAALFTSIGVYRVFFHPLRHVPGPFALKVTQLYMPWLGRDGQLHRKFLRLHEEYGDFVRVGPNSVAILHEDALTAIHGARSPCSKKGMGFYESLHYGGCYNLDSITDREQHRDRRAIWDKALSVNALKGYEAGTRNVVRSWLGRLEEVAGRPIDTSHYATLIAFDNMGGIGFSADFGTVREGREDKTLELLQITFGTAASLGHVYWPMALMMNMPKFGMQHEFEQMGVRMADERLNGNSEDKHDMLKYFLADLNSEKPRSMVNMTTVYADSLGILVAATDTVASALSLVFYHLARDATLRQKLYNEVAPLHGKTLPDEFVTSDLDTVSLFEGLVNEALRLNAPTPIGGPRSPPSEGITIAGTFFPAGTILYTPTQAYHSSERYFVRPHEFIPERWTTRPELVLNRKAFFPFHMGRYDCVGKKLAKNVIRTCIAYTIYNYDFHFAPGEDGRRFRNEEHWNMIVKQARLDCVFTKREHV